MEVHLYIQNGRTVYEPVVEGSITWETKRKGQPGKCTFTILPDQAFKVEEGNSLRLDVGTTSVFFGFIFERSWNRDGLMKITAYDQLRYLKNKNSYFYENLTAAEVVQMIAGDYRLNVGELQDTGFVIPFRIMTNKALFDIILDAVDVTMIYTGRLFVFYDDAGKLTLKNIEDMKLDLLLDQSTAQDYDYQISIDQDTYNQIKLYCKEEGSEDRQQVTASSAETINKWGLLQMDENVDEGRDIQALAEQYLKQHNRPTAALSIKGAFGAVQVRAGCLLPVFLTIGDMELHNYLLIESVTHKIDSGIHTMDLTLRGAGISG